METTFDSIIEKYNEKNEFITKIWVWIATISIFGIIIIAQPSKQIKNSCLSDLDKIEQINFPIIDLNVPSEYFVLIYTLLITGLIIRWVEAFRRSASFRQNVIEPLIKNNLTISVNSSQIDSRRLLDGIVYSTTTSVWGIVPDFADKNSQIFQKRVRGFVYIFLKIIVFAAHFFLPLAALIAVVFSSVNSKTPLFVLIITFIFLLIAVLMIIGAAFSEWKYSSYPMSQQINK